MRAAIYARVSTDEQAEEGHSIDAQLRLAREFCAHRQWIVIGEYIDEGFSGRTLERPRMQALIADVRAKQVDVVVVHKLDRLSRSILDTLALLNDWNESQTSFASATEQFDFTTAIGKVTLALLAAFAQYFIDNLREETKKGKRERAMQGLYNGTLPFGYQRIPKVQGGVPILHPENIEGYRFALQQCADGYSVRQIVLKLNARGFRTTGNWGNRPFSEDTVLPMIKNRFYLGEVSYKGNWMPGRHMPAVDAELWERAQEQLRRRAAQRETTKTTDRIYPLRKILHCAVCGRGLRGHTIKGARRYRDPSKDYGENCPEAQSIPASMLEDQIGNYLSRMKLPLDWKQKVMARLNDGRSRNDVEADRMKLKGQLDRAKHLFMLGDIDEAEYRADKVRIEKAIAELPTALSGERDLNEAARLLENFAEIWQKATDAERLRLLHAAINKAYVRGGRIVAVEPRAALYPLLALADATYGSDGIRTRDLSLDRAAC